MSGAGVSGEADAQWLVSGRGGAGREWASGDGVRRRLGSEAVSVATAKVARTATQPAQAGAAARSPKPAVRAPGPMAGRLGGDCRQREGDPVVGVFGSAGGDEQSRVRPGPRGRVEAAACPDGDDAGADDRRAWARGRPPAAVPGGAVSSTVLRDGGGRSRTSRQERWPARGEHGDQGRVHRDRRNGGEAHHEGGRQDAGRHARHRRDAAGRSGATRPGGVFQVEKGRTCCAGRRAGRYALQHAGADQGGQADGRREQCHEGDLDRERAQEHAAASDMAGKGSGRQRCDQERCSVGAEDLGDVEGATAATEPGSGGTAGSGRWTRRAARPGSRRARRTASVRMGRCGEA